MLFLKIQTIYVKMPKELHNSFIEYLFNNGYSFSQISPEEWDYNIETGKSYEVTNVIDLAELKHDLKQVKHEI